MALTGTHQRSLDDKNRLALPKPFREIFCPDGVTQVVIAPETASSLALFSLSEFQRRAEEIRAKGGGAEVKAYLRMYFSQAENLEIDKQGRIRIPERLMEFGGLKSDVTLLGVNDRVEVWDSARWQDYLASHSQSFDSMAQEF